jgi:lysozyme family protein
MADFHTDYQYMEANEDRAQLHAIVPDAPPGAHAISGINSAAYPEDFARIAAIPQAQRGPAVEDFYRIHFWNEFEGQLSDQIAERVLDEAVNAGPGTGVRVLQKAINLTGGNVIVDGAWGPATISAANLCDQTRLLNSFRQARLQHYKDIAAADPSKASYLGTEQHPGPWWIRALQ